MNSIKQRLTTLEQLSETIAVPPAALVHVIGPDGRSSEQIAQAAAALAAGTRIVVISYKDASRSPP